jgi:two-component system nitrogen regulation sensor histidine kinase NtrY
LHYLAAYAPFISADRKITGFLHLPYFEKQNERSREVSGLLSALLNIYVLLFALTLFVTAFISSRITKPLALIQEKLAGIRLGKRSEPIVYAGQDEIGLLVQEYNRMVQELADSAEKLARSERESAWREMARQVAHEIKNPLTPMRLSIQHLLRAWNDQSTDRELMLKRVTQTLIEQIDSLSYIATEFSNFAQLPPALPQRMDLVDAVRRTVSLFSESYPDWIRMDVPDKPCIVMADKEQLGRIFSNLLKNAIQAIPDDRKGAIIVNVTTEDKTVRVDIKDNGEGVAEEIKSKIFVPNFTTKSGGTGLGLAMVKNLIEQAHGEVSFSSREGLGTTFTVRWPLAV